jgi:hypothetical protein
LVLGFVDFCITSQVQHCFFMRSVAFCWFLHFLLVFVTFCWVFVAFCCFLLLLGAFFRFLLVSVPFCCHLQLGQELLETALHRTQHDTSENLVESAHSRIRIMISADDHIGTL